MSSRSQLLIVDDDTAMREMLASLFSGRGYAVEEAASAAEALERADEQCFDVVLSDIRMPGKTGIEMVGELRGRRTCARGEVGLDQNGPRFGDRRRHFLRRRVDDLVDRCAEVHVDRRDREVARGDRCAGVELCGFEPGNAVRRAGAQILITYHGRQALEERWL